MKLVSTADQVVSVLRAVMAVPIGSLERLVQAAHRSGAKQVDDPPQPFGASRQALRMFWHLRCNLEAVEVFTEGDADD